MATSTDNGLFPLYTTQFSTNLELLLQQKTSKLRGKVSEGMHVGKMASPINQIGAVTLKAPAGRFAPKNRTDPQYTRRWVFPQEGEEDLLVDSFDELQTIVDPKSQLTAAAAASVARAWDDVIILQATATSQIGQDAASLTSETFTTASYQVAANFGTGGGSANGLSVAKLIEARRILQHYHNDLDMDPPTAVIGSQQEADLLSQVQVVSTEFGDHPVLVDGRLRRFLGYDIVVSERLPQTTVGTTRGVLIFVKTGVYLGMWKDMTSRISIRNDLSGEPYDLYVQTMYGATRTQLGKVLQVLCADTTGADITP